MLRQAQLITKDGYPLETHHVTTDDGYILGLHRIPTKSGRPVIIMHGILDSSSTWVLGGPKTGLGQTNARDNIFVFVAYLMHCFLVSIYRVHSIGFGL